MTITRPASFRIPYITSRHLPYRRTNINGVDASIDGGVLKENQIVWLSSDRDDRVIVSAFVDHIGEISVDARFLIDLGRQMSNSLDGWNKTKGDVVSGAAILGGQEREIATWEHPVEMSNSLTI